jgi:hypothetical protein
VKADRLKRAQRAEILRSLVDVWADKNRALSLAFNELHTASVSALREVGGTITSDHIPGTKYARSWDLSGENPPQVVEGLSQVLSHVAVGERLLELANAHRRAAFELQEAESELQVFVGTRGGILTATAIVNVVRILDGDR